MQAEQSWFCEYCHTSNYMRFWTCRRCQQVRDDWCELDFDSQYFRYTEEEEEPVFKLEIIDMKKKLKKRVKANKIAELIDFLVPEEKWKPTSFNLSYVGKKNFEFVPKKCDRFLIYEERQMQVVSEINLVINDKANFQIQQIRFCYKSEKLKTQIEMEKLKGLSEVWLNSCSEWYKGRCRCLKESCCSELHEDGWVDQKTWMSFSPYVRLMRRFKFSATHLNVDPKTWRNLSDLEKSDFRNRRKRWLNLNSRNFTDVEKKNLKFWSNRVRYKGKILIIKGRNLSERASLHERKALTEVDRPINPLKLKGELEGSARNEVDLAKSVEILYNVNKAVNQEEVKKLKVNVNQPFRSEARTYESSAFDQVNVNQPIKFGTKDKGFITCPNWKPPDIQQEEGDD